MMSPDTDQGIGNASGTVAGQLFRLLLELFEAWTCREDAVGHTKLLS